MRRVALLLAALLATTMIAACGHPLVPSSAASPPKSAKPAKSPKTATRSPRPSKTAAADLSTPPTSPPILGVDVYALSNYPAAEVAADGQRVLSYIKNVLNADAVGIVWNLYAPSRQSDAVEATDATLSASNVGILTRIALQDHLRVEYRPLVMVTDESNEWEGLITPADPAQWFSNYYDAELPYLRAAQQFGIGEFVATTEMHELDSSPLWPAFFARAAQIYHGTLSYSIWDGDYFSPHDQLLPVKFVGMDMYYPLKIPAAATSAEVTAAWESMFSRIPASVLQRTAIDETGIQARLGAYQDPANLRIPGQLAEQVQANWYVAACDTVERYHLRGVYFWKVDLTDYPASPATSLSTFEGKEGAAAISACARILH
jgi:hypothetical protein